MINTIQFSNLTNWSFQYNIDTEFSYNENFKLVTIGDFLKRNKSQIKIQDEQEYKRVTIKIRNGGVFLRDKVKGKSIGTKNQFTVSKNQFLISKIDARNGAFGVIPDEVDGAIITGNFWTFDVDYKMINPTFLSLIVTTPEFIQFCENASNGSTNRHYLQEKLFLAQQIPLPPLNEQNRIINNYDSKMNLAKQQEVEVNNLENEIEKYLFDILDIKRTKVLSKSEGLNLINFSSLNIWGADRLLRGGDNSILTSNKFENKKLSEIISINPRTDISNLENNSKMSFIPMECISDTYGVVQELKEGEKSNSKGYTKFKDGDLIWARITPCMQNGKSSIVNNLTNGFGYGSTEFHVLRSENNQTSLNYIYHLLRLKVVLKDATNHFTGSAGQQRVPKSYLENLVVPFPPISIQDEIANYISNLKSKVKNLKEQSENNKRTALQEFENEIFNS